MSTSNNEQPVDPAAHPTTAETEIDINAVINSVSGGWLFSHKIMRRILEAQLKADPEFLTNMETLRKIIEEHTTPKPRLRDRNDLIEEIKLPADFPPLMIGRPELLKRINRPLSAEETQQVVHALAVLHETNLELQQHIAQMAELVKQLQGNVKGIGSKLYQLADYANFRATNEDEDE